MKLSNLINFLFIIIFFFSFNLNIYAEDEIDIWKKKSSAIGQPKVTEENKKSNIQKKNIQSKNIKKNKKIGIEIFENISKNKLEKPLYGIFDPDKNDLTLNIWSNTNGDNIKSVLKRINKLNLSSSAEDLFINTILTYTYPPSSNLSNEDFLNLKINWLIKNKKNELLEEFLVKNKSFKNKKKIINYLVDSSIAKANISDGCKKSEFISKETKDPYLEKFKIYCLVFNNKKNEAQLILDLLREQKLSDKFFDNKINFLLGVSNQTVETVKEDNLLNFYLSSITIPNFKYEPTEKTDKYIWEYLNSANLINIEDYGDKEKIRSLEVAANNNTLNKSKIFEIYQKIPFDLNKLINAENIYQSMDGISSRALIYQKFLLSENEESKLRYLFLLKDLFKKEKLSNVFKKYLSETLKEFETNNIPEEYASLVANNIISEDEYKLGKIKFDDKILHKSRVLRHFTDEGVPIQKTQKDLNNIYKKIKRNRSYFFSAKDLVLIESLELDGFRIPKEIKINEIAKNYNVPDSLINLLKNDELGLLVLKFVEIIGEDEIEKLDSETVYFMTHILNKAKLIKFRNKVIIASLPSRY